MILSEQFADVNLWREAVLRRIGDLYRARTDAKLAPLIGVSPSTITTWRKRSTMPFEALVEFAVAKNHSTDWLFFGTGRPSRAPPENAERSEAEKTVLDASPKAAYEHFRNRHKISEALVDEVLRATGFKPAPVLLEAMKSIAFTKQIEGEHLLTLVAGVQQMLQSAESKLDIGSKNVE